MIDEGEREFGFDPRMDRHMMREMLPKFQNRLAGLMFALMLPSAGIQAPGSIDGSVVALGSSTPVPRASVTLSTSGGRKVAALSATIDGRFSIPDISPGEYRIAASQDGFVPNARGSVVTVVSGRKTDISIGMVPDGAISGRVLDWDGIPVVGRQVQALAFVQDGRGQRILAFRSSAETNDLGEYRIYWLLPGPYFVSASPAEQSPRMREAILQHVGPTTPGASQFVSTYFPSAVDATGARRIDLRSGETFSGADIRLVEMRKHRVSGVVSNSIGGRAVNVRLTPRNPASGINDYTTSGDRTGSFRFENVVPGSYVLTADNVESFGRLPIDVGERDVENVAVLLTTGFDLRIRMTIEGRSRRSDDSPLVVNLRPAIPSTPFPTVERNGDDELTMHRVMPGDYSVAVLSLTNSRNQNAAPSNGGLYLKSAQFGGSDVLTAGLHIDGSPSGVLDIVMADGAGTQSGVVRDDRNQPVPGVTVVLVPEPRMRGRTDLYKTATTDTAGKFDISGITPGQYKVFSWEAVGQGSWQYPDFMELYEDRGQSIRIDSARRDPVTVQLIPARN